MDQEPRGLPSIDLAEMGDVEGVASVSVKETSDPPGRSVIHWPDVQALEGERDIRREWADWRIGRSSGERFGASICRDRNLAAPSVMAEGHVTEEFEAVQR